MPMINRIIKDRRMQLLKQDQDLSKGEGRTVTNSAVGLTFGLLFRVALCMEPGKL